MSYTSHSARLLRKYAADNPQTIVWSADKGWHDTDPTVVTEVDVLDAEREAASTWYRCDECNDPYQLIAGFDYVDICPRCAMAS